MIFITTIAMMTALQGAAPAQAPAPTTEPAPAPVQAPAPVVREVQEIKVKIGNLCDIRNLDNNYLHGIGLVKGLQGTGDQSNATKQMIANGLKLYGLVVPPSDLSSANTAAVSVMATLESFRAKGAKIDITVAAMEAKSLAGGFLERAELLGPDGKTYVIAQGPLSVGGGFQGVGQAASVTKGHLTVATIPNGGLVVEDVVQSIVNDGGFVKLDLRAPDFTTSKRVSEAINAIYPKSAESRDAGQIWLRIPDDLDQSGGIVSFLSAVLDLEVVPESLAIIVINERTGTLVSGENVKIGRAGIAHGPLTIAIEESTVASQPNPLANGETVLQKSTNITVDQGKNKNSPHAKLFPGAVSVAELVNALNELQVTPKDMIAILQLLKKAGALHAQLETM